MNKKEFWKDIGLSFFVVVTLINVATFALGSIYEPEARFGYDAFLAPILYGLCSMIPVAIMYSKKELSRKEVVIRKILQLISIEVILVLIGLGKSGLTREKLPILIGFCASIFVVFVLANIITWLLDSHTAKTLTTELQQYQKNHRA